MGAGSNPYTDIAPGNCDIVTARLSITLMQGTYTWEWRGCKSKADEQFTYINPLRPCTPPVSSRCLCDTWRVPLPLDTNVDCLPRVKHRMWSRINSCQPKILLRNSTLGGDHMRSQLLYVLFICAFFSLSTRSCFYTMRSDWLCGGLSDVISMPFRIPKLYHILSFSWSFRWIRICKTVRHQSVQLGPDGKVIWGSW